MRFDLNYLKIAQSTIHLNGTARELIFIFIFQIHFWAFNPFIWEETAEDRQETGERKEARHAAKGCRLELNPATAVSTQP